MEQAKAQLEEAQLNLSYTTITSPVNGVSELRQIAEGSYLNAKNGQLTTVSVLSPMWINFSLSENQLERIRGDVKKGTLKLPERDQFVVEVELVDGSLFPHNGRITFTDPSYNAQTGTFLLRASVDNPEACSGPINTSRATQGRRPPECNRRPAAGGAAGREGHFVWIVDKEGKAEQRPVASAIGRMKAGSSPTASPRGTGGVDGAMRLAPPIRRSRLRAEQPRQEALQHVLAVLHRAADLRGCRLDHPVHRRAGVDGGAAGRSSSRRLRRSRYTVSATYPGADCKTLADSVASPIEAQINGVDNMLYMSSTAPPHGQLSLTVYFSLDTNPDIAQVQVQNRVNLALPQLPSAVTQLGVSVQKKSSSIMMLIARLRQRTAATPANTSPTTPTFTCSTPSSVLTAQARPRSWVQPTRRCGSG